MLNLPKLPVDGGQQVNVAKKNSQLSAAGDASVGAVSGAGAPVAGRLPDVKGAGGPGERRMKGASPDSGIGGIDSRLRLALGLKKEGPQKMDFFKLAPNPVAEYSRSEYVLNTYFQDYIAQKIKKTHFAGISYEDDLKKDHLEQSSVETPMEIESTERQSKMMTDRKSQKSGPKAAIPTPKPEENKTQIENALRDPNIAQLYRGKVYEGGRESIAKFTALQRVQTGESKFANQKMLTELNDRVGTDFETAVSVAKTRTTLYSTIIDNAERYQSLERTRISGGRLAGISIDISTPFRSIAPKGITGRSVASNRASHVKWDRRGTVNSTRHLMPFTSGFSAEANLDMASNVYLPENRRVFFRRKSKRGKLPSLNQQELKKAVEDSITQSEEEQKVMEQKSETKTPKKVSREYRARTKRVHDSLTTMSPEPCLSASEVNSPTEAKPGFGSKILEKDESIEHVKSYTSKATSKQSKRQRNRTVVPLHDPSHTVALDILKDDHTFCEESAFDQSLCVNQAHSGIKHGIPSWKYKERRQSFNLCQTKFQDVQQMYHPLKKVTGPTLNDLATIKKMEEAKRYPIPESLLHKPYDFELTIDSLMHEAYNNDDGITEDDIPLPDLEAPCNSQESVEQIDFYSSSDDAIEEDGAVLLGNQEEFKDAGPIELKQKVKALKLVPLLEALQQAPATRDELLYQTKMKNIKVHTEAMKMHGLDIALLKAYPKDHQAGNVPSFLINMGTDTEDIDNATKTIVKSIQRYADNPMGEPESGPVPNATMLEIQNIHKALEAEFESRLLLPSLDHLQLIYEHYCAYFGTPCVDFLKNLHDKQLSIKSVKLSLRQCKAIACVLPLVKDLEKLQLRDNGLSDESATLLVLASFLNPCLKGIAIEGTSNKPRQSTYKTLRALMSFYPKKLTELSFSAVGELQNALDYGITDLRQPQMSVQFLDLSHQALSPIICQTVNAILIHNGNLRSLNLQSCHLANYSMTQIMDGLCRNFGLQSFNIANNSMASPYHEYAIKMATAVVRHPDLMHADISMTQLTKEEIIFIGMSLSKSQSMMSLHMSGCGLEYYERVFLRTLIDAKCSAQFRKLAHSKMAKQYKPMDKRNFFLTKVQHETFEEELEHFLAAFAHVEQLRLTNHDEAFEKLSGVKLIKEEQNSKAIDVVALFEAIKKAKGKKVSQEDQSKAAEARLVLQDLINKLTTGGQLIGQESREAEKIISEKIKLGDDAILLQDLRTMGLLKKKDEEERQESSQKSLSAIQIDSKEKQTEPKESNSLNMHSQFDERFQLSQMLKIDRIKQRVQVDALKHLKSKSAGEIALMFQGIGKLANEILQDQPMGTYMTEVVFSRQLGHDEIEDGEVWRDTSQCWICEKWNKCRLGFQPEFADNLKQDMQQMHQLDKILQKVLDGDNQGQLEPVTDLKELRQNSGARDADKHSVATASEDRLETESLVDSEPVNNVDLFGSDPASGRAVEFEGLRDLSELDPINSVPFDRNRAQKMLPSNHRLVKPIHRNQSDDSDGDEESDCSEMEDIRRRKPAKKLLDSQGVSDAASHHFAMNTPGGIAFGNGLTRSTFGGAKTGGAYGFQFNSPAASAESKEVKVDESDIQALRKKLSLSPQKRSSVAAGYKAIGTSKFVDMSQPENQPKGKKAKPPTRFQKEDGRWYRDVKKSVFWQGQNYEFVEEERIPTDQEDVSSESVSEAPATSEDEQYEVDDELVQRQFTNAISHKFDKQDSKAKANQTAFKKLLKQNAPVSKSIFDRRQVYLCASFNDWVPIEMRSLHELRLIRQKGEDLESYISECKKNDGEGLRATRDSLNQLQVSAFIPPGRHFFYFIQDRKHLCLSTDHKIVRYKGTCVFLNELTVLQREGLPLAAKTERKAARGMLQGGVTVFCKPRSVFKTFQEDDDDFVKRMLRNDLKHSKIQRLIARAPEAEQVLELLQTHYKDLKNIFLYYSANSKNYPRISQQDFQQYCYRTKLFCRNFTLAALDKAFVATNASINGLKNQDDRELNRYEFMEILIRVAQAKYQVPKIHPRLDAAFEALLTKDVIPASKQLEGEQFRADHLYTLEVDEIFTKNQPVLRKVFDTCCQWAQRSSPVTAAGSERDGNGADLLAAPKIAQSSALSNASSKDTKVGVSMQSARDLLTLACINVKPMKINQLYVEALMSKQDPMKDPTNGNKMKYNEFIVFLARIAHEIYIGTAEEAAGIQLHTKIDEVLPPILQSQGLEQVFSFRMKKDQ